MKSQQATANAAERQRSRSEVDTGRRTGLCFGLCSFFGRENRNRFSRRAGPSIRLGFGRRVGLCFLICFGPRASSSVLVSTVGPQPAEGRNTPLSLRLRSPLAAAENELGRLVMNWVVLLRFVEPPGLRAGPSAHPGSAQPEPDGIGAENWAELLRPFRVARAESLPQRRPATSDARFRPRRLQPAKAIAFSQARLRSCWWRSALTESE